MCLSLWYLFNSESIMQYRKNYFSSPLKERYPRGVIFSVMNDYFNKNSFSWENKTDFFLVEQLNFTKINEFSGICSNNCKIKSLDFSLASHMTRKLKPNCAEFSRISSI